MTTTVSDPGQTAAASLDAQLADPRVAASLATILEHADLLALLVEGLDEMVARSEVIGEALTTGISEIRQVADSQQPSDTDPGDLLASLSAVASALPKLTSSLAKLAESGVLDVLLESEIASPAVMTQVARLGQALAVGAEQASTEPVKVSGAFGMVRALKDPDIGRGLGFFLTVLKAVGAELDPARESATR